MSPHKRLHTPDAVPPADDTSDERLLRIHQRPDGYHWIDVEGRQEFGPFDTLEEALADMDEPTEEAIELAEMTEAAEQGLDIDLQVDRGDEDEPESAT
ncbi:MAG: hypothetical protein AB1430_12475 [Pseudomonadota bacterium]